MKYVGILMMAAAVTGAGFLAAERWRERLLLLLQFRQMVYYLKGQILYTNATLPEAFYEVGTKLRDGKRGNRAEPGLLLLRVERRLREDGKTPFSVAWQEEVERLPADFPMSKSDRQILAALGENLGYADRKMQERTLLFYLEQTEDSIAFLKKESDGRMRLYRCMGMAAGLFLMVLMV